MRHERGAEHVRVHARAAWCCLAQVPDGDDGQTAEMRAGDRMVVKYTTVEPLVRSGQVVLL
jgi:hypothetical protein